MSLPEVVAVEEWLDARRRLLTREKEMRRKLDQLNADRRRLPMVRIDKDYRFNTPDGEMGLADLFGGCRQLIVQHVMFDPSWEDGCASCTAAADELSTGLISHLRARDTAFVMVSRAPLDKLLAYRAKRGWDIPWVSSEGSDFNYDFHVSLDASVAPVMLNYRGPEELREAGFSWALDEPTEQPGYSCFLRDDGSIYHTYSTFARGTEQMTGAYGFLDSTALGRQEDWEEPKGRVAIGHKPDPNFQ